MFLTEITYLQLISLLQMIPNVVLVTASVTCNPVSRLDFTQSANGANILPLANVAYNWNLYKQSEVSEREREKNTQVKLTSVAKGKV